MELPFTSEQFFDLFEAYNLAIWPAQFLAYVLGWIAAWCVLRESRFCDHLISLILAAFWIWNGAIYHLRFFTTINKAAYLFGVMFIFQGVLFFWYGNIRGRLVFGVSPFLRRLAGCAAILYAMFIYTGVAILHYHQWPRSPMFGVAPCPMTIFTFGLLLWTTEKAPWQLLVIPSLWSFIAFSAAILLGVKEDFVLPIVAVVSVALLLAVKREQMADWMGRRRFNDPLRH